MLSTLMHISAYNSKFCSHMFKLHFLLFYLHQTQYPLFNSGSYQYKVKHMVAILTELSQLQ